MIIRVYVAAMIVPIAAMDNALSSMHSRKVPILNSNSHSNNIVIACIFK
jgi:hypothetical protein